MSASNNTPFKSIPHYEEAFDQSFKNNADGFKELRRRAMQQLKSTGFPTRQDEAWKYTPVQTLLEKNFVLSAHEPAIKPENLIPFLFGHEDWPRIVFVNGRFCQDLSRLPRDAGIKFESLRDLKSNHSDLEKILRFIPESRDEALRMLNTAFLNEGGILHILKDKECAQPIHIIHVASPESHQPSMIHPRLIVLAETHSKAAVVESFVTLNNSDYWQNPVLDIRLAEGASLDYLGVFKEGPRGFHTGQLRASLERSSRLDAWSLALSGQTVRRDIKIELAEEGSECNLYGFYWVTGKSHMDHHLNIEHPKPHGTSRQLFKGILDQGASAVFTGRVYVHEKAQKTSAEQVNKTLLLSEQAKMDTQPQLEIYADDVKCSHGAAVGQIDKMSLFYFKTRGISEEKARRLLCYGFASEVIQTIPLLALRQQLDGLILENVERLPSLEG